MNNSTQDQVIALAGVCQAVVLVQSFAHGKPIDVEHFQASLGSILNTDPENTESVFNGINTLKLGLTTLVSQLSNESDKRNTDTTRYVVGLIALERRLSKRKDLMSQLGDRITQVERQRDHFELTDEQILASLAAIYSDIISPLGPRIQVTGNANLLQQKLTQQKIRAALLAGLRASVLWRQVGGKRRHILLSRNKLIATAKACLNRS